MLGLNEYSPLSECDTSHTCTYTISLCILHMYDMSILLAKYNVQVYTLVSQLPLFMYTSVKIIKNEIGYRDDTVREVGGGEEIGRGEGRGKREGKR